MRQFVLPPDWDGSTELVLRGKAHHYLSRVLRFHPGQSFTGCTPAGEIFDLTLKEGGRDFSVVVPLSSPRGQPPPEFLPEIFLFPSLLKGKNPSLIVRQAAEAGVAQVQFIRTQNGVVRGEAFRTDRFQAILREAAQQSGNPGLPRLKPPVGLGELDLERCLTGGPAPGLGLFFHEKRLATQTLHEYLKNQTGPVFLFFGPEGGFAPAEVERFLASGLKPAYLGGNVLRAETAVIFGIAAVLTILREKSAWQWKEPT
ncbi:MAG: 16S rRNA (uracil(1498)-N(3))-methyltransferase [Spirochaetales bacterium]|jgi:16S rRNA (uracil1498-N3)-methyltransferase|nr:16S rRNA (uracil(1498)-N(3))-methyltransferase [Spirochaetales bacterium]